MRISLIAISKCQTLTVVFVCTRKLWTSSKLLLIHFHAVRLHTLGLSNEELDMPFLDVGSFPLCRVRFR